MGRSARNSSYGKSSKPVQHHSLQPLSAVLPGYLELQEAAVRAQQAFHLDPTPENLTAWSDAMEPLVETVS